MEQDTAPTTTTGRTASPSSATESESLPIILIVDDERSVLSSLRRALRSENYRVLTADNPSQGLSLVTNNDIALVICDYRMPGMSGDDFLKIVRKKKPGCRRVMLSGASEVKTVCEAIADGLLNCQWFIPKPWDNESLKKIIREALGQGVQPLV